MLSSSTLMPQLLAMDTSLLEEGFSEIHQEVWLRVSSYFWIGNQSSKEIETILHGLKIVKVLGYRNIIMECDNLNAVSMLERKAQENGTTVIMISTIQALLVQDFTIAFNHVIHEG